MQDATMQKLTTADRETHSPDLVAENLAALRTLFPELITEGPEGVAVNIDVLKALVGDKTVTDAEEKYGLNWHGKRRARQLALTPSTGTLRPCPEESVDWETTQNLMIEGDNLEVLKLLQKSYAGKVKLIYIDPPYNTGKDFVYPDNFQDNIKNYLELTGQTDEGGKRLSSNTEASGRFHTDWLNMMYPRLKLARNLLTEDGFFVASIDDSELSNLRTVLNDVLGEENFVAVLIFDRNRKNDAKLFSVGHEYMVVYARNKALLAEKNVRLRSKKDGIEEVREVFDRLRKAHGDNWTEVARGLREYYATFEEDDPRLPLARYTKVDERGPYMTDGNPSWPGGGGPRYDVAHPATGKPCKVPSRGWVWSTYERMKEEIDKGNIVFGANETTIPGVRMTLFESDDQVMRSVIFSYAQKASQDFAKIFDGKKVFDNPKSYVDLERLVDYLSKPGDLVLDFFAGSGTTGHGVMLGKRSDDKLRRFIIVQLPEPLDPSDKDQKAASDFCDEIGKPRNIAELTKERLRRAGKKIREESPLLAGDLGFRVFKLASSNIREWDPDSNKIAETLEASIEHLKADRTEQDILFELLLNLGLDLCVPIETQKVEGSPKQFHVLHSIGGGSLLVCLSKSIPPADVEPLALALVGWHQELKPAGDTTVIFRDSAFADDVAKTNITAILQQQGLETVRSL
jgi:adenine-specific DNA-methyltransferase